MAKNYKEVSYFATRPDVVKVFDDLDAYRDFCRFELCEFNPSHLYDKTNPLYKAFLDSQRKRMPNRYRGRNNEQNISG